MSDARDTRTIRRSECSSTLETGVEAPVYFSTGKGLGEMSSCGVMMNGWLLGVDPQLWRFKDLLCRSLIYVEQFQVHKDRPRLVGLSGPTVGELRVNGVRTILPFITHRAGRRPGPCPGLSLSRA
jgi:hypothetical protein